MSRFSIVVPSHNQAALLPDAIASVHRQRVADWELVVVDDGSTDDTQRAVEPHLGDARFRYFWQPNSGVSAARNSGIRRARGEYVILLDADDELADDCLELHDALLRRERPVWVLCDFERLEGDERRVLKSDIAQDAPILSACLRNFHPLRSICFRRDAFERFGYYDESWWICEDVDLYARYFLQGVPFAYLDRPAYRYRIRRGSLTKQAGSLRNLRHVERLYRTYFPKTARRNPCLHKVYAERMWELAGKYRLCGGTAGEVSRALATAVRHNPQLLGRALRKLLRRI